MNRQEIKLKKLEKQFARLISEAITLKVDDVRLSNEVISITRVEINQEKSTASVFFTLLNQSKKNKVIKVLYTSAPFLMAIIQKKLTMRNYPKLKFFYDFKENEVEKILNLIDKISQENKQT